MTMLAVGEGWLISEKEAEQMEQETLEQVLIQRAWAELQAVPSYMERHRDEKHDKEQRAHGE